MKQGEMGRRVSIVFEETGGEGFKVYLDGASKGIDLTASGEDLSPADFYASRMLLIVTAKLKEVGALSSISRRS
jgi:hypothetical protein